VAALTERRCIRRLFDAVGEAPVVLLQRLLRLMRPSFVPLVVPQNYTGSRCAGKGADGRLWPEPEATLGAGGVRCLGSTCRRSVGPDPPLVTHSGRRRLICLDAGEPDHLSPFIGFVSDELTEVGWRSSEHHAAQIGKAHFHLGIGEGGVDLIV
jgi:hypothetical protein